MDTYEKLIANFTREIRVKPTHGIDRALTIFRRVLRKTKTECGEIPHWDDIHDRFEEEVRMKTNWGYKQLVELLDVTITEVGI
ncbi:hypothetical protein BZG73_15855 [Salinivibrio siamensis]|uniref:Integrase n=1 Tax=Salinivibrio siamensis TaxID=414286 RepID=A0ABX3K4R1_9GAMM|nr:hypothetical protein [Salinivibrio siamensis]OOE78671.1 hypothetical protein BZG73_15855 [Salinivibrio siamensis]